MTLRDRLHAAGAFTAGSPSVPRSPLRMVVEISNACNLRCTFCPRTTSMTRPVRFMEPAEFARVLDGAGDELENVSLNGFGEPLLHPDLGELVALAHARGLGVSLSTNCTLLDERRAELLLAADVDHVTLAIDGIAAEHYEAVRVGARFDRVLANARRFLSLKAARRSRTFAVVQCIALTENERELANIRRFWRDAGHDAIRIRQLTHTGNTRDDERFVNGAGPCYWLWAEPMLLADGRLVPCCQDIDGALSLGSAFERPLAELWSGENARRLRVLHVLGRRDEIPLCRDCNMYQPTAPLALGASLFETNLLNRWVPAVETVLSRARYR